MAFEQLLDLSGIDLIPALVDEELFSSNQIEQAVCVSPPEISGKKIAVAEVQLVELIGPIALDRRRALNRDFADFIGRHPFSTIRIYLDLDTCNGSADRLQ